LIKGTIVGILEQIRSLFRRNPPSIAPTPPRPSAPALASRAPQINERRGKERINAREGTRVLIIDDSKTIVTVLKKFLRSAGYETLEALDAESGLAQLHPEPPELIFLDIVLPGMNGFAALRAIRRDPATRNIPVIMMSGNEQAMEQFFGTRIGADDFMKKPFSRYEVFFRIERLLDADLVPQRATPRLAEQAMPTPA
jgi:twitching motility two-component system response regulator PilH